MAERLGAPGFRRHEPWSSNPASTPYSPGTGAQFLGLSRLLPQVQNGEGYLPPAATVSGNEHLWVVIYLSASSHLLFATISAIILKLVLWTRKLSLERLCNFTKVSQLGRWAWQVELGSQFSCWDENPGCLTVIWLRQSHSENSIKRPCDTCK